MKEPHDFLPPLLPFRYRYIGMAMILPGLVSGYMYYLGGKPSFFNIPVFAVMTSYLETRYFVIAQTNLLDEAAAILILAGLIFTGFSREKNETGITASLRLKALIYAVYIACALWILLFMVIFGWPIIVASATVFSVFLLSYLLIFRILLFRFHQQNHSIKNQ